MRGRRALESAWFPAAGRWRRSADAGGAEQVRPTVKAAAAAAKPADVNAREADGSTPCSGPSTSVIPQKYNGCSRPARMSPLANNYGATPMSLAATTGDAAIIGLLLKAGADPDSPTPKGRPR